MKQLELVRKQRNMYLLEKMVNKMIELTDIQLKFRTKLFYEPNNRDNIKLVVKTNKFIID